MLKVIEGTRSSLFPREMDAMFRNRASVFSERLGWDVIVKDGRERDVFDRVGAVRALGQSNGKALDFEHGFGVRHHTRRASFGSSRSRRPSPSTLTASTVSARQMPGKKMLCG